MIKKVTDTDILSGVSSPLLPLIYADFEFGFTESDGVYAQISDENEIISIFSLKNGCATLTGINENVDSEELNEFFSFLSVKSCLSDKCVWGKDEKAFSLLKCNISGETNHDLLKLDEYSRLSDYECIYCLLNENGKNFPEWFAVTSKKINGKKSVCVYKYENNVQVSVAIATAIYNKTAVISGVFTDSLYRKKGYASQCVSALLSELGALKVESVYLWCEENNLPFYEKIGFINVGSVFVREDF